jgi:outer membrane protein OmpA-like peptidoglycan-associated protein
MPVNRTRIAFGILAAFVVATLVARVLDIPVTHGRFAEQGFWGFLERLRNVVLFAWPAAVAAIVFATYRRLQGVAYWAIAGALIGIIGFLWLHRYGAETREAVHSVQAFFNAMFTGLAGGLAYWLIGEWRGVAATSNSAPTASDSDHELGWGALALAALVAILPPVLANLGTQPSPRTGFDQAALSPSLKSLAEHLAAKGYDWAKFEVQGTTLRIVGDAPDERARLDAFATAVKQIAPNVGPNSPIRFVENGIARPQARTPQTPALSIAQAVSREEEEARLAAEAEAKRKAEEDARLAAEAEAKRKAEEDARLAAEAEAKRKAEEDARLAAEAEAKRKAEEDARLAAEAEAKRKAAEDARLAAEAEAKRKAEEDARLAALKPKDAPDQTASAAAAFSPPQCRSELALILAREPLEFAIASTALRTRDIRFIDMLADRLNACATFTAKIGGFADPSGEDEANRILSLQRAEAIKSALALRGVAADRIVTEGYGANPQSAPVTLDGPKRPNRSVALALFDSTQPQAAPITRKTAARERIEAPCTVETARHTLAYSLNFRGRASAVRRQHHSALDRVAAFARRCTDITIVLTGHADSRGSDALNRRLSERRARRIRDALIRRGVAAHQILAQGASSDRPIASNDTIEGRALNRRVDFSYSATVRAG